LQKTGIRYFNEIPGVKQVIVNDLDPAAVEAAKRNVEFNGKTLDQVSPQQGDGILAMMMSTAAGKQRYDVIDLDPYGSAAPFIDAAVQSVADGGLLCVTCTDMAVLSGNQPEACYAK
jgi:tRNA (guanine26-N2/guanine27-N2)-dimethyltransferase